MKINQKKRDISTIIGLLAVVILIIIFYLLNNSFLNSFNIKNLLTDMSPLLVMSVGVTFVIIMGSTDLSIGATCSLASVLFVRLAPILGWWVFPAVLGFGDITSPVVILAIIGLLITIFLHIKKVPASFLVSLIITIKRIRRTIININ